MDEARLAVVCADISPGDLRLPTWDFPVFYRRDPDALAGQILLFNTINFCYWGDPPWEVEFGGQWWSGSMAMLGSIHRALDEGIPILDGAYLAQLTETDLAHLLRGRGQLHLMAGRLAIWREVGRVLTAEFDGRFTAVIADAGGDALGLARLLVERFPSFDDVWLFEGRSVRFYKRAQLAAAMFFEAFGGQDWGRLARMDQLTVFADYKLPQVLRRLGILVYDEKLAAAVDGQTLIPAGSRWEVEIRVATVWAAELMRRALVPRLPEIIASYRSTPLTACLDYWLWYAGRQRGPGVQPHHRTLTTAY
jgi:hypothetical protein